MRKSFSLLALILILAAAGLVRAEDSLFSAVPIDSVFSQSGASSSQQPQTPVEQPKRLFGAARLGEMLRDAGYEPAEFSPLIVSTKMQIDQVTIPVVLTLSADQSQLEVMLLLGSAKDEKQLPADKLLTLLAANRQHAPAYFSYSEKNKRTELHRELSNQGMSSEVLKAELTKLNTIAKETQAAWNIDVSISNAVAQAPAQQPAPSAQAQPAPAQSQAPAPATAPAVTAPAVNSALVGRWSAAKSDKEAFAMLLGTDGAFVLVHVNNGKQTRTTGKFTLSGQTLSLVSSDGTRSAGTVSIQSAKQFQFLPQGVTNNTAALTFKKAA